MIYRRDNGPAPANSPIQNEHNPPKSVSYTHLTLPTSDLV